MCSCSVVVLCLLPDEIADDVRIIVSVITIAAGSCFVPTIKRGASEPRIDAIV